MGGVAKASLFDDACPSTRNRARELIAREQRHVDRRPAISTPKRSGGCKRINPATLKANVLTAALRILDVHIQAVAAVTQLKQLPVAL